MVTNPNDARAKGGAPGGTGQSGIAKLNLQYAAPMPQALALIPEDVAKRYSVLPLSLESNTLRVFMANPSDILTIENLSIYTRRAKLLHTESGYWKILIFIKLLKRSPCFALFSPICPRKY